MAFDNFTLHRYRALQECPQGQHPGDIFEATQDAGAILIQVGAAELVVDDAPPKKFYKRRDLTAEPR